MEQEIWKDIIGYEGLYKNQEAAYAARIKYEKDNCIVNNYL